MMGRRGLARWLGLAFSTVVLASTMACGDSGGGGAEGVVKYGGQQIVPDLVFRGKNWGKSEDVRVKQVRFPSGGPAFEALLAGDVNVSNGGSGRLITIAAQRPDAVQLVAKWQYGGTRYSVMTKPDSPIKNAKDLEGKTVAVDKGSGAFTLFGVWLKQQGVQRKDVRIIQTKVSDVGSAIEGGSADVGVAWEPTASILVEKKLATRLTTLESAGQSPNFLLANKEWAEEHREELVSFLRTTTAVSSHIEENPEQAGKLAAEVSSKEGTQVSSAAMAEALRHIQMKPTIDGASLDELTELAEGLKEQGRIPRVPDFESMVDKSYLEEAQK